MSYKSTTVRKDDYVFEVNGDFSSLDKEFEICQILYLHDEETKSTDVTEMLFDYSEDLYNDLEQLALQECFEGEIDEATARGL